MMAEAYTDFAEAKLVCDAAIETAMEELVNESKDPITATQKKFIKKIAKAMSDEKLRGLSDESKELMNLLEIVGPE
jgi:hypothetical protein